MRLIDADALFDVLEASKSNLIRYDCNADTISGLNMALCSINIAPTVEAVVLPCKPGTTVYEIMNNTDACLDCEYRYFSYAYDDEECEHPEHQTDNPSHAKSPVCEKHFMEVVSYTATERQLFGDREKFGKTIFLTREEAEAALAKMNGGAENA